MKLVLNRDYGGYGLSIEAVIEIFKLKGLIVYPYVITYEMNKMKANKIDLNMKENYSGFTWGFNKYLTIDPKVDSMILDGYEELEDYKPLEVDFERTDPDLIKVVEELGEKANSNYSELEIVEIPNGFEYTIDEYDGMETVYYGKELGRA